MKNLFVGDDGEELDDVGGPMGGDYGGEYLGGAKTVGELGYRLV